MVKTVQDIMSRDPPRVSENEFLTRARQLMRDEGVRGLPVLDDSGHVVGVIDEIDTLRVTATKSNVTVAGYVRAIPRITPDMTMERAARELVQANIEVGPVVESTSNPRLVGVMSIEDYFKGMSPGDVPIDQMVEDIMEEDVKVLSPDDPVSKAWNNMREYGFSGYPVVQDDRVVGVVTRRDLLEKGSARIKRESRGGQGSAQTPVERVMTTPARTTRPTEPVRRAFEIMLKYGIGRLPVVKDGGEIIGIVDRFDVIRARLG